MSIPSGTDTTVTSTAFVIDTDTMGGTANQITIKTDGVYAVSYSLLYLTNNIGTRAATVAVSGNGSALGATGQAYTATASGLSGTLVLSNTRLVSLFANNYLTLVTYQNTGSSIPLSPIAGTLQAQYVSRVS
jgi:hypothetical protein